MFLTVHMRHIVRYLFLLFLRISGYLGYYTPPKYIPSEVDVYEKKQRVRFLDQEIIENDYYVGEEERQMELCNQNIDSVFYDRKELIKVLETNNNVLECAWKARILYESTPRGNIVMFYDVYKNGFSYYSDQTGIPYKVLNAVAMKYVIMFRCRDFFMDETISSSPFIKYNKDDEKKEQDKKNEVMKQLSSNQNLPFVKFKNRQSTTQPSEMVGTTCVPHLSQQQSSLTNTNCKEYVKNRFIYKGKMNNWSPLQKPPPKKTQPTDVLDYKTFRDSRTASVKPEVKEQIIDETPNKSGRWWHVDEEEEPAELNYWRSELNDIGLFGSIN